jgi:hypothetical protein
MEASLDNTDKGQGETIQTHFPAVSPCGYGSTHHEVERH